MRFVLRTIGQRLLSMVPMLFGVTLLVFVVLQFSPNDPAYSALGVNATPEAREAYMEENGLNDPVPLQYVNYLGRLFQGNLGSTTPPAQPVLDVVAAALPVTLQLAGLSVAIAVVLAAVLGVSAALYRDKWLDQLVRFLSVTGVAMPTFFLGILLIENVALRTGVLPSGGYVPPSVSTKDWFQSLVLPALSLGIPTGAALTRTVRTAMVEELDRDYVRTAIGNGLPRVVVVGRNVLRNALITPLTVLGLTVGHLLGGAVVIETVFGLPGMGTLVLQAVTTGDPALMQGVVLTVAIAFLLVNLVVDLLYLFANPRLRGAS